MTMSLLPLGTLGAIENAGTVTFGIWLPWVSAADGNAITVKVIHERDQFLQNFPPREFPLAHSVRAPYGDFWSATVPIAATPATPGSAWGSHGRYLYRYRIDNPNVGSLDWIIDPCAREFGVGKLSAFTLGYQSYAWSAAESNWRTPALQDLVFYEINVAELGGDLERTGSLMAYLADLGVNAIEVMPLSNVAASVDWGYLPIGYFGVDERFGKRSDFQQMVDIAHQHGIAVIVDAVYGHAGVDFPYFDAYTRLQFRENPFIGPFAKDYFSNFGNSTWQNRTFDAAKSVARGDRGRLFDWGMSLGLFGYTEQENTNGDAIPKTALQYIENHDHERFLCNFGMNNPDEAGNPLFFEGDRNLWYMLQPYLIAVLMSKGLPLLWQGEEFGENYFLPDFGAGRVALLRPLRWDFFYDTPGQRLVQLMRKLLRIRRNRAQIRRGAYYFFHDWQCYQSRGVLLFARYDGPAYTLVAINVGDADQTVPFWFPMGGNYLEELHGGGLNLSNIAPLQETALTLPSHYGRIWTAVGP